MNSDILHSLWLSLKVALTATTIVAAAGTGLGWLLAKKKFPGRTAVEMILCLPLVLPPTVTGYYLILLFGKNGLIGKPLYELTGFNLMFSLTAAVTAAAVVSFPLMVRTARAAIEGVDKNLLDASRTLGHTEWTTFRKVTLPLARKGLLAGISLSFARAMGEFGATLMIAGNIPGETDTMPIKIYTLVSTGDWSSAHPIVLIMTAVSGLLLYLSNRWSEKK